jgi:hypothetical protein
MSDTEYSKSQILLVTGISDIKIQVQAIVIWVTKCSHSCVTVPSHICRSPSPGSYLRFQDSLRTQHWEQKLSDMIPSQIVQSD